MRSWRGRGSGRSYANTMLLSDILKKKLKLSRIK